MQIEIVSGEPALIDTEALVVGVFEESEGQPPWTVSVNRLLGGEVAARLAAGDARGKLGEVTVVASGGALRAKRVIAVGLGKPAGLDAERIRRAVGRAVRWLDDGRAREATLLLHLGAARKSDPELVRAAAEAAILASHRTPSFGEKAAAPAAKGSLATVRLLEPASRAVPQDLRRAAAAGQAIAESTNLARRLAELPGNQLPPRKLADEAVRAGAGAGLKVAVFDEKWLRARKMGGILGVAQGSAEPPRLIVIEHRPRAARRGGPHIALVGKGVTFDTGGISLKPREDMDRMKYDMSGAAAVIGAMRAVSLLDLPLRVTGIIPTVENMPSGTAIKPGDVLLSYAGKSIEVGNTDAEGRLILADAISFAGELDPDAIVDIATLTGACKIALGTAACGLVGNDAALIDALRAAGEKSGERAWPLPLYDEYTEDIQSEVADLKNMGGRGGGGALTAAAFLKAFAGEHRWAHLDIAGTAWIDKDRDYLKTGAAGFGVRLFVRYLESLV